MRNISEYVKCRDDIFYFFTKYLRLEIRGYQIDIVNKLTGLQTGSIENFLGHRGSGLSTITLAYLLWKCLFNPSVKDIYISSAFYDAKNMKRILVDLYDRYVCTWDFNKFAGTIMNSSFSGFAGFDNESCIIFCHHETNLVGRRFDTMYFCDFYKIQDSDDIFSHKRFLGKNYVFINTELPILKHPLESVGNISTYPWYCNPKLTLDWYEEQLNRFELPIFLKRYGCTRG